MGRPAKPSGKASSKDAQWFDSTVQPTEALKKYCSAMPRGMTNPPQNPLVRAALLNDLKEYGTQLEYSSLPGNVWPPPTSRSSSASTYHADMMSTMHNLSVSSRSTADMRRTFASAMGSSARSRSASSMYASTSSGFGEKARKPRKPTTTWKHVDEETSADPELDSLSMSHGNSTCRWRTAAVVVENRKRAEELAELRALRASGPFKKRMERVMEDRELQGHVDVLKARSANHEAVVGDRFKFSSDTSKGSPLVISGSGAESAARNDAWRTDMAQLLCDHSGAMRRQHPSALQPTPEDEGPKYGKKKQKKDEDHLEMRFKPLYPVDKNLTSLRRLKKIHFPAPEPEKKVEVVVREPTAEERAATNVRDLGLTM